MRVAGVLQPGTTLGYVVEGKHIRGSLIVVQTLEERDALLNSGNQVLVNGTPIYVASNKKTYRYNSSNKTFISEPTFVEDENGVLGTVGEDGEFKKIKLNVSIDDLDPTLKETIDNLPTMEAVEELFNEKLKNYIDVDSYNKSIEEINSKLEEKQNKLIAGNNIKIEGNVISAIYENLEQLKFSNKADFPYQGKTDVLYIAKDNKEIYIWDETGSDYALIGGVDFNIINGGNATFSV